MGLLDGKVVAITGAGAGIGREHAILAAKEGARVVVNDLGGSRDGAGADTKVADQVVQEIKDAGGDAVGHYEDISRTEGAESLIKAGVDKWGQFDALVNNAGILRDKMSFNMTDDEWDLVIKVHLRGHFMCARAACQYFRKAGKEGNLPNGGAIVNTSSTSGLLGNPGQANYGAAKMGIIGMMNTMAQEFTKYNVRINTIAPMALTRLTEDLPIAGMMKQLTPAHIAPVVIFLCSDAAEGITGQVFGTFGKYVQIWRLPRPVHYYEAEGEMWDPNDLAKHADHMKKVIEKVNAPYMPGSPGPKFEE
ncbi:MAG: SDR family oxidoreductase [bacterium]